MKLAKHSITYIAFSLLIVLTICSCKHEAQWCNGKIITVDTTQSNIVTQPTVDTTTTPKTYGAIFIDSAVSGSNAFVKSNITRRPYSASIDGGKTWSPLPINDTTLSVGTYKVIIKDGDGCESEVYTQKITY